MSVDITAELWCSGTESIARHYTYYYQEVQTMLRLEGLEFQGR